ncbi:hypothetical protein AKJ37_07305 [candidate division MSBL1 archaeon SCGC-AAA259I09]|uniref:Major facilitator superfamily (MFS) profile domain-containing protein n=1 Tax=candidate division MSBL1 archaeon SCGC-AAA259I09 TaxID=1698267 RepID=A0A133UKX7_9EURY|nr:hypothetical protein AKJ37_07305 [candidate division MSBL1 archaeon SCGC-AAA259I09]
MVWFGINMKNGSKSSWIILSGAWLIIFSLYILLQTIPPLLPLLDKSLNISHFQGGLLYAAPLAMIVIFSYPLGYLSDRIGVFRAVKFGVTIAVVAAIFRAVSRVYYQLLFFNLIFGVGFAWCYPNLPKIVKNYFPPRLTGTATGIYTVAIPLGSAVGIGFSKLVCEYVGSWQNLFLFWGIFSLLSVVFWWFLTEKLFNESEKSSKFKRQEKKDIFSIDISSWISKTLEVFTSIKILVPAILLSLLNLVFYSTLGWMPTYLIDQGWQPAVSDAATSFITFVEIPAVIIIPFLSDKLQKRRIFVYSFFFLISLTLFSLLYHSGLFVWVFSATLGISFGGVFVTLLTISAEVGEKTEVGRSAGLILSMGYLGALMGPPVIGYMRDFSGMFAGGIMLLGFLSILAAIIGYLFKY